jgi:hypothetical protein
MMNKTLAALFLAALAAPAAAAGKYDVGATDTTIKLGNTFPYSGPVSVTAPQVRQMKAYFDMLNDKGGINGRKIDFVSLDDGYQPPKTVELTRRLVEQDQVLAMFGSEGTPTQVAVQPYLNNRKIPQLFVLTGSNSLVDPKKYPYTVATGSSYGFEGLVWAKYILAERPNAKIGIFYQDDDFGSDHITGFMAALGDKAKTMVVGKASYAVTDPTVTSQIISLKSAGADTFVLFAQSRGGGGGGWGTRPLVPPQPGGSRRHDLRSLRRERQKRARRGRRREAQRPALDRHGEGHDRSCLGGRSRRQGLYRADREIRARIRPRERSLLGRRLYGGTSDGRGPAPRRRRSDARQYHENRHEYEGLDLSAVSAGHCAQHLAGQPLSDARHLYEAL